jgi:1-aminocyclopropane-1-carboxylate deaminase
LVSFLYFYNEAKLINKDKSAQELSMTAFIPKLGNISNDHWDNWMFRTHDLRVDVLRLDKIHPEISGNKWFKLKYWLEKAKTENKKKVISFGGAYSNHLLALAAAAKKNGFLSKGIIRGEEPAKPSRVLMTLKEFGMDLRFVSRSDYEIQKNAIDSNEDNPDVLVIPEGGGGFTGVRGAEEILSLVPVNHYTHICCAVGTGATLAGLVNGAGPEQKIIGVSILKGTRDWEPMHMAWIRYPSRLKNVEIMHEYHFGGYARSTQFLIDFMNKTYAESGIPTDFVYTAKLFYSIEKMVGEKHFPPGSRLLVLHTGGLQGNWSLETGLLQF